MCVYFVSSHFSHVRTRGMYNYYAQIYNICLLTFCSGCFCLRYTVVVIIIIIGVYYYYCYCEVHIVMNDVCSSSVPLMLHNWRTQKNATLGKSSDEDIKNCVLVFFFCCCKWKPCLLYSVDNNFHNEEVM